MTKKLSSSASKVKAGKGELGWQWVETESECDFASGSVYVDIIKCLLIKWFSALIAQVF